MKTKKKATPILTGNEFRVLNAVIHDYIKISEQCNKLCALFGMVDYHASPLMRVIWEAFDRYVENTSELIGDHHDYLSWYIHDNQLGKLGKTTTCGQKIVKITNVVELADVIAYHKDIWASPKN